MIYDMSEKLNFDDSPVIKVNDKLSVSVKADAETVLKLMSKVLKAENNLAYMQIMMEAGELLFSEKDRKQLLKLSAENYIAVIEAAIKLAVGDDPDGSDEDTQAGE